MLWHWSSISATSLPGPNHLDDDPEELERVSATHDQVVIGVEPAVEVEGPEPSQPEQLGHDELDVGARCVVTGVKAHHRLGSERADVDVRGAPVRDVGVIKSRLEELVLEHQPLVVGQLRVDGGESFGEPVLAGSHVALAGVVRSVGKPDLEVS
jgi:hypothetical protein